MNPRRALVATLCVFASLQLLPRARAQANGTAWVRNGFSLNGTIDGSLQMMLGQNVNFNSGSTVTGDFFVPGTPTLKINGSPVTFGGTVVGTGSATPSGYTVTLGSNTRLGSLQTRTNSVSLPAVAVPPAPGGTRNVSISSAGQSPGDFATLKNLNLNANVGAYTIPAGTYGDFTCVGGSSFVLGVQGSSTPAVYNFQHLTVNSGGAITLLGPVVITVVNSSSMNGPIGSSAHPEWLKLQYSAGDFTLNQPATVYGTVLAPAGKININNQCLLAGNIACEALAIQAGGTLRILSLAANQAPTVSLTSPVANNVYSAPTNIVLAATAGDADGSIAKVEFFSGATKLGEALSMPYQFAWNNIPAGSYALTARATDNLGATTTSTTVAITVNALPTVGITGPPSGSNFTAPATIPLLASASDSDGSVAKVEFYNGATRIATLTTTPYSFSWSNVAQGAYSITAVATDNLGFTSTSTAVPLQVTAANQLPTVVLTSSPSSTVIDAPANISLIANATDPDGTVASVEFFQGLTSLGIRTTPDTIGGSTFTFAIPSSLAAGNYTFTARAVDNTGAPATSNAVSTVVNALPTAVITDPAPSTVFVATAPFNLTASASDPDGRVTSVAFYRDGVKIGESTSMPYSFTVPGLASGTYSFTAQATDNYGRSGAISAAVSVRVNMDPAVSLSAPTESTAGVPGIPIPFSATATDADGTIATVEFFEGEHLLGTVTTPTTPPSTFAAAFTFAQSGVYTVTARATDNLGTTATSAPVTLTVSNPPVVALTAPANNAIFSAPASFPLTAAASDSDGSVAKVEFYRDGVKIGEASSSPYQVQVSGLAAGNYVFTAKATDNDQRASTSGVVNVTVNTLPFVAITSPIDNSSVTAGVALTLVASATDADGTVTRVEFFDGITSLGDGTLTGANSYSLTLPNGFASGMHSLTARATDNLGGNNTSAAVVLTVNGSPTVAITAPANGAVVQSLTPITLTATAADADGSVAKVEFFDGSTILGEKTAPDAVGGSTFTFVVNGGFSAGAHSLTARATDNLGLIANSTPVAIVANASPAVAITAPANNAVVTPSTSVTFSVAASDSDGSIVKVEVFDGATKLGDATAAGAGTYSFTLATGLLKGSHAITAKATDDAGGTTVSSVVTLVANTAPVANAQSISATRGAPTPIALTGSDADQQALAFTVVQSPTHGMISGSPPNLTYTSASDYTGSDEFTFKVSDGITESTATVSITVILPVNQAPVVDAGPDVFAGFGESKNVKAFSNIIINHDEWTLTEEGFAASSSSGPFARNIANWITGGRPGKFLAYTKTMPGSIATAYTGASLRAALESAGHTWVTSSTIEFTLENLKQYDAVFLSANQVDNQVLIDYVNSGGTVYISAGTKTCGCSADIEAGWYNTFLNAFGLAYGFPYNGISGTLAVQSTHPIFYGISSLFYQNGNPVMVLDPNNPRTSVINTYQGRNLIAMYSRSGLAATVALKGAATDDSLPSATLTYTWSKVSGPDLVYFENANLANTQATFTAPGVYTLRLTVSDGVLSSSDTIVVTVDTNNPPQVYAGGNAAVRAAGDPFVPNSSVTDVDEVPLGRTLTATWRMITGPVTPLFSDIHAIRPTITFPASGIYVLELTGDDSAAQAKSITEIRVGIQSPEAPDGIAAWWPGNSHPHEIVAGHHDLTFFGGETYTAGQVSDGFSFTGSNYAMTPAHADLNIGTSTAGLTVEFWAKPLQNRNAALVGWGSAAEGFSLRQWNNGPDLYAWMVDTNGQQRLVNAANFFVTGAWVHVAFTYDRSTGIGRIFRNGILFLEQNMNFFTPQTSYDFYVGASRTAENVFNGVIDEISLYRRPLAPAEIARIYSAGAAGKCAPDDNAPPTVNAGPDLLLPGISATAQLLATVTDDNKPFGAPTMHWTWEGPGVATFANENTDRTSVTFNAPGVYLLTLTASDGLTPPVSDVMEVRVGAACPETPPAIAAWWPGNGSPVEIVTGGHSVELINGAGYAPGKVLQGFSFDGVDDYGKVPAHPDLDIGTSAAGFTIELWVKPGQGQNASLVQWINPAGREGVSLRQWDSGPNFYAWTVDTAGVSRLIGLSNCFSPNTWVHIAFTYDQTTGMGRIYRNGAFAVEQNIGVHVMQTSYDFYLGTVSRGVYPFKGTLDEVSLYRRPLSAAEIAAIYDAGVSGKCPPDDNLPPTVSAGPDLIVAGTTTSALLEGVVNDDDKPFGPAVAKWSMVQGPVLPQFADDTSARTTATFGSPGVYLLKLTGSDRLTTPVSDLTVVRVGAPGVACPPGAVAWWPANGDPRDLIKGGHDVDLRRGAGYTAGTVLQAFSFDGVEGIGKVPAYPDIDIGTSPDGFTIEMWAKPGRSQTGALVQWMSAGGAEGLSLRQVDTIFYAWTIDSNGAGLAIPATSFFSPNVWVHLAFAYNKATGIGRLYKNGVEVASQSLGTRTMQTSYDLYVGATSTTKNQFQGVIDEVTLYNRPLTAAEIAGIANAGLNGKQPPAINLPPVAVAGPDQTTAINTPITLTGSGSSDDGLPNPPATLTYAWTKVSGPGGVSFGSANAATTTATFDAPGSYTLRLTVSDSLLSASDDVVVTVTNPPAVAFYAPANNASLLASQYFEIAVHATDSDGSIAKVEFFQGATKLGQQTAPVVGDPTSYFWPMTGGLPVGSYTFTAKATDNSGISTTSAPLAVTVVADPGLPVVVFGTPTDDTRITKPTTITGIASSTLLARWNLQQRLKAAEGQPEGAWTTFATGTTSIGTPASGSTSAVYGDLAVFDPTSLINGIYELRLVAADTANRETSTGPVTVVVEGNMKIGAFSLAFEDLKVPVAGIPITITRTYDSRDTRVGDFGPGWRLALNSIRLQKNANLALGWEQTKAGDNLNTVYYLNALRSHIVTIVMPDGETLRFEASIFVPRGSGPVVPDNAKWATPIQSANLVFKPIGDTTASLLPDGSNVVKFTGLLGSVVLTQGDPNDDQPPPYNPARFRLTTKDGTVFILDEALGLLEMRDLDGNTLVLNRDAQNRVTGVTATQNAASGPIVRSVSIVRTAAGLVDYISDPLNRSVDYLYDAQGRLSSFTNRESNITQFRYENTTFPNYLTKIIDPRGITALRSEYDPTSGKLIKQIDADGKETVFNHGVDASSRVEKVRDRLGKESTFVYDDRGNVTTRIDPLGAQTTYSYYPDGDRVKFETDHYGNVKSFAYDAQGNVTVQTLGASASEDPANPTTGYTTRTSYNAQSAPTLITDPDGRMQKFDYDPATNNLLTHTVGYGGSAPAATTYTYYSDGTLDTITDALGNVTKHTYNYAFSDATYPGAVKQTIVTVKDPAGAAGSDAANAADTVLRTTRTLFDAQENQLAQIVTRTRYDGGSEDVVTRYDYDTENRLKATTMPDGRVTETRYTSFGKQDKVVLWKSRADYLGRVDANARITSYGYDARGNQVLVTYADGMTEAMSFDAENRKTWSQDRRGYRTFFTYDENGHQLLTIHPDANDGIGASAPTVADDLRLADNPRTETVYDLTGRVTDTFDELRHRTTTVYFPDGTPDASRRKQTVAVRTAGNLVTNYQYDKAGNVRFVTDPRGNTVETRYDEQGRPRYAIYPATDENPSTQTETKYDVLGRRIELVDQENKVTRYRYDGLGRLNEVRQYIDASAASADSSFALSSSDPRLAVTRYTYDALGNQQTQVDALGRTTTYGTDMLGRRTTRILPKDATEGSYLTENLQYDEWGNLWKRTDFAGKTTTFGYDTLNRLKSKTADATHPSLGLSNAIARIEFDYDANGVRTAARTYSASNTQLYTESTPRDACGRIDNKDTTGSLAYNYKVVYGYHANNLLKDVSHAGGLTLGYRYDEVNRLEHVDDASTGVTRTTDYTYNANGSLETMTQPNSVVHAYGYDTLNRLRTLAVTRGATTIHAYEYKLRPSGHRRQVLEGAKTTTYGYDDLYRLTSETIASDPNGNSGAISYGLNKVGNRESRTSSLAAVASVANQTYNARDWLAGDSYNANGSTTTGALAPAQLAAGSFTDTYDFEERLILRTKADGSTINLSYDADGHRIAKNIYNATGQPLSLTTWLVDTNNLTGYCQVLEERVDASGGLTTRFFTYGTSLISQAVSVNAQAATLNYYATDGHGNVRELTDGVGGITDRYDYDAFGNVIFNSGATANMYRYAGEQFDSDLGLYYNRARYLNPDTGRFWSMDDFEGDNQDPISLHKYLYANGNPVKFFDPSGQFSDVSLPALTAAQVVRTTVIAIAVVATYKFTQSLAEASSGLGGEIGADPIGTAVMGLAMSAATVALTSYNSLHDQIDKAKEMLKQLGKKLRKVPKIVPMPRSIIPKVANHVADAQAAGKPILLTRTSSVQARANRRAATAKLGFAGLGMSWDEYPFASSIQGGGTSSVRAVPLYENLVQGGIIGASYMIQNITVGDSYVVIVIP